MVNRQIESDWWRMAVDGGLCPNLGARQVKASHRHFMGSGSTGSKSKVLGLCWRTGWLSEGDVFGGGVAGPGGGGAGAVSGRWSVRQQSETRATAPIERAARAGQLVPSKYNIADRSESVGHSVIQSLSHSVIWSVELWIRYGNHH